jgi:hypothetical protein
MAESVEASVGAGAKARVWTRPALWWRIGIVLSAGLGLTTGSGSLVYFTVESNVIVLGYFIAAVHRMITQGTVDAPAPRLRGAATLYILITGLVAHIVLNHGASPLPGLTHGGGADRLQSWSLLLLHYTTPIMVLVDWLCLRPRNASRWRDLPVWLAFPLGYAALTELRAALFPFFPNRYPYFFLDPAGHGYGWVGFQIAQLTVEFVVLAAVVVALDRLGTAARSALTARGGQAPGGPTPSIRPSAPPAETS